MYSSSSSSEVAAPPTNVLCRETYRVLNLWSSSTTVYTLSTVFSCTQLIKLRYIVISIKSCDTTTWRRIFYFCCDLVKPDMPESPSPSRTPWCGPRAREATAKRRRKRWFQARASPPAKVTLVPLACCVASCVSKQRLIMSFLQNSLFCDATTTSTTTLQLVCDTIDISGVSSCSVAHPLAQTGEMCVCVRACVYRPPK